MDSPQDIFNYLTPDKKYNLLRLVVKKVVYFEEAGKDKEGNIEGKIIMDLWELPAIDPSQLISAKDSAEYNFNFNIHLK